MADNASLRDDLGYVASAIRRRDRRRGVPQIFFLWALLILVGWSLPDFAPRYAGWFWLVAAPAGGLLSWWLGNRSAVADGEVDRELGFRHGLHWLITGLAFVGVILPFLVIGGSGDQLAREILLVVAYSYALAAVHLERGLALPAAIMGIGYVAVTIWSPPYLWTTLAVIVAVSLVAAGIRVRR